jgi:hypothetical protein
MDSKVEPDGLYRRKPTTEEWRYMKRRARAALDRIAALRENAQQKVAAGSNVSEYLSGVCDGLLSAKEIIADVFYLDTEPIER